MPEPEAVTLQFREEGALFLHDFKGEAAGYFEGSEEASWAALWFLNVFGFDGRVLSRHAAKPWIGRPRMLASLATNMVELCKPSHWGNHQINSYHL